MLILIEGMRIKTNEDIHFEIMPPILFGTIKKDVIYEVETVIGSKTSLKEISKTDVFERIKIDTNKLINYIKNESIEII